MNSKKLKPRQLSALDEAELLNIELQHAAVEEAISAAQDFIQHFANKKLVEER
jgi:hypothetical protein